MAYRKNNSGCGCLIAIIVVLALISGVRGCTERLIDGDLSLPKLGSGRVSGGSGGYGTSNGYNVKYNQTTPPNKKSSLNDYTHTNSQPTEYREGKSSQSSNNNVSNSPSSNMNSTNSYNNGGKPLTYYKTCPYCSGYGKRVNDIWFYENSGFGTSCKTCGRSDTHRHSETVKCEICNGKGEVKMELVDGPTGKVERRVFE